MGLRGRDQIWQLLVAIGATTAVLIVTGILLFGGAGDDTATVGLTVPEDGEGRLLAGPSGGGTEGEPTAPGDDPGSERRSGGPIGDRDMGHGLDEDQKPVRPAISVEAPVTTAAPNAATSTTAPAKTEPTTTTSTTTSTTEPITTSEPTTTVAPPTKPTEPTVTIGPIETLPPEGQDHSITPRDLAAARGRWRSMGYDSYAMTVHRICFCPDSRPLDVVVRNGKVQSVQPSGQYGPHRDLVDDRWLTVPGLFDLVETGFEADSLRVVFDKSTGIPLTIEIDYHRRAVDDEITVLVVNFVPHRED